MSDILFCTREDVLRYTSIGGNVDTDKIMPHIKIAQDLHILPLLGTKLYEKLQTDISGASLAGHYETLVEEFIQPALVHLAATEFISFHAYEINNGGIYRHESENATTLSANEIDNLRQRQLDIANHYRRRLVDHLVYYPQRFPEYNQDQDDGMYPQTTRRSNRWLI